MICPKSHSGAGVESNYFLILKSRLSILLHHLSKGPIELKCEQHSSPQKNGTNCTIAGTTSTELTKMAAPCWAPAPLRHHTARPPLAPHVRAEPTDGWWRVRPGTCPVLPRRKMALPFARSLCLCRCGAKRLGVAAAEARRGRIISFYSFTSRMVSVCYSRSPLRSSPLPHLLWSWDAKPGTVSGFFKIQGFSMPSFSAPCAAQTKAPPLPCPLDTLTLPCFFVISLTACFRSERVYVTSSRVLAPVII